jgi:heptosyltransferase-2
MKVLCACPIGLGNYLMTYPSFTLLRSTVPTAELHLLALRHSIAALAQDDPLWKKVHVIDPTRTTGVVARLAFIRSLAAEHFDASLSFFPSNTWQYNLLPFLSGIPKRFAFGYSRKKAASLSFLNTNLLEVDAERHDVDQSLRLVSAFAGVPVSAGGLKFPSLVTEMAAIGARRFLEGIGGPRVYVGVHPGSTTEHGMGSKRWDPVRFGELATRVCNALGAQALIFGGREEEDVKRATASAMQAPYCLVAPTDLPMTAAILGTCTVMLSNDSGLMHLAACLDVPTAALFGPTDERRNGPMGTGHLVVRKPMDGFPLWTAANVGVRAVERGVDPNASLKALSVNDAWERISPWLAQLRERTRRARIA